MSQEQIQVQVMRAQGLAGEIEFILRDIFSCERFGFGGQVNSDRIRRHPYLSMVQGLAYLFALKPQKREAIENFVEHCVATDKTNACCYGIILCCWTVERMV